MPDTPALLPRGTCQQSATRRPPASIECVELSAGTIWIEQTLREWRWKAVRPGTGSVATGTAPTRDIALRDASGFVDAFSHGAAL